MSVGSAVFEARYSSLCMADLATQLSYRCVGTDVVAAVQ